MQLLTSPIALGIDIGSVTSKLVVVADNAVVCQRYERHRAKIRQSLLALLDEARPYLQGGPFTVAVSGSAGIGLAEAAGLDFVQEVYATAQVVQALAPATGVVIELGGEDAKVIFFQGGVDQRMNGSCAGGTGAFIDQMAALLNMTVAEMDAASLNAQRIYPIASRCGVFAKTDIQALLNQGANKADVAASIYQAVVNQTITGLVQGRAISGPVLFLGGPLYYCQGLRQRFQETLGLDDANAVFPADGRFAVARGAAMYAAHTGQPLDYATLCRRLEQGVTAAACDRLPPLFTNETEYAEFQTRHAHSDVAQREISAYQGDAWLGIDCGSTTTKLVLIAEDKSILYSYYSSNQGNPLPLVLEQLKMIYRLCGERIRLRGSAVTGYGEDLIRHAFHVDEGLVETIAHYTAARFFQPQVDFILDIGGQDIKCFRIRNQAIDSILLNEACSSGCGSFIETFARSLGYEAADFAHLGLTAAAPVDLGSRCTVFMNSSVKQAQKDGATVADISAGLSVSVVKNALYKVIRATTPAELGERVVVQGGTFHNDAVLRAFERELGRPVIRPAIAGLMGAYGAALHIQAQGGAGGLLDAAALENFSHSARAGVCRGCANHCPLTINRFADGQTFISGNQCQKGAGQQLGEALPDLYEWKRQYLHSLRPQPGRRGKIGLPLALATFELAPLWQGLFSALGFEVCFSALSSRATYEKGQFTIPSDTACYPAKIMHGHLLELLEAGITTLFYPSITYNVDEHAGDNHYNCPIVAFYGQVLHSNMDALKQANFLFPYLSIDSPAALTRTLLPSLRQIDPGLRRGELRRAVEVGFACYHAYTASLHQAGEAALKWAREHGKRVLILAGRPYHIDPEISHGIDKLAASLGLVVVSEDSICQLAPIQRVQVLDQWTFHSRLYRAAAFAASQPDVELVQLVSFGCGVDAITSDECRAILERAGKHYTQIKIDEITNLGAVRVRLRSLLGALEERE